MTAASSAPTSTPPPRSAPEALHDRLGRFVFATRDYLTPALALAVLWFARPRPFLGDPAADRWLDALGIAVALAGEALRYTVIGYAYIKRGGTEKQLDAPKLVVQGFYAHSRNPMYVGNFLMLLGLAIVYNAPFVWLVVLPGMLLGIHAIVRAEERFLSARFGPEYDDYCRRVNRFLPSPRGLRETMASMRYDAKRALRKEYGTTFSLATAILAFLAIERVEWFGWEAARPSLVRLALAWLAVLGVYLAVRRAKKSRRLDSPD